MIVRRQRPRRRPPARQAGLSMTEFTWCLQRLRRAQARPGAFQRRASAPGAVAWPSTGAEVIEVNPLVAGQGAPNPIVPAALRSGRSRSISSRRRAGSYTRRARRRPSACSPRPGTSGLKIPVETTGGWGPASMDVVQVPSEQVEEGRHRDRAQAQGYGAFIASTHRRQVREDDPHATRRGDRPRSLLHLLPGRPQNTSGVNDPKLNDMILLQRRTFDESKRREIIFDIQRYSPSRPTSSTEPRSRVVSAWEPYVKNFMPNIGNDYGGRLMARGSTSRGRSRAGRPRRRHAWPHA